MIDRVLFLDLVMLMGIVQLITILGLKMEH